MLKSILQIAIRNFTKRKTYSILNLLGLTIGITCCLLIFEYVAYERSYDSYNRNANRIYRVQESDYQGGRLEVSGPRPPPPSAQRSRRTSPRSKTSAASSSGTFNSSTRPKMPSSPNRKSIWRTTPP